MLCHLMLELPYNGLSQFWPIYNCSITKFEFNRPGYRDKACMAYVNDICHLKQVDNLPDMPDCD